MRAFVGTLMVLALAGFAGAADEKYDIKMLLGKWEPVDGKKDGSATIEFADKGKLTIIVEFMGKNETVEGGYKLDGDKLEITIAFAGKEKKETLSVTKLTDMELVTKTSGGKVETLKRKK